MVNKVVYSVDAYYLMIIQCITTMYLYLAVEMSSVRIYHKTNIFIHSNNVILRAISLFVYPLAVLNHHLSATKIVFGMPLTHHTNSLPRLVMHRQARSLLSGSDCCICILICILSSHFRKYRSSGERTRGDTILLKLARHAPHHSSGIL